MNVDSSAQTRWPARAAAVLSLAMLPALACATYSERTDEARRALWRGDLGGSLAQFNKVLKVRDAGEIPRKLKKNHELVILERATVLQAMGRWEDSAVNFEFADKQLELLDIAGDAVGKIGKYIYSDSSAKYKTSPTEKLSINAMNMCNYLAQGDLSGAKVEAKRFTVMRKYLRDSDPDGEHGAFGSYLAGFVFEREGNANEALRYYEEALGEREFRTLREVIPDLAQRGSYRGERIKDYLPATSAAPKPSPQPAVKPAEPVPKPSAEPSAEPSFAAPPDDPEIQRPSGAKPSGLLARVGSVPGWPTAAADVRDGEILVVAKVGRVPYRVPERIPIGLAIGLAGAFVTGDTTLLEYGMFKFVVYPELVPSESLFETAAVKVDGHPIAVDLASDLGAEIVHEYEDLKPKIIGAALTRMITRAAAAEGARAAGRQADGAGGLVGFLAAAAVEGTLVALDKPDTRSWTTLPDRVFVARSRLPAGVHSITVEVAGNGGRERRTVEVEIPAGGYAVLDVTTLR